MERYVIEGPGGRPEESDHRRSQSHWENRETLTAADTNGH